MTVDLEGESSGYYLTKFVGSWARERCIDEMELKQGWATSSSSAGVSSHEQNPFICKLSNY